MEDEAPAPGADPALLLPDDEPQSPSGINDGAPALLKPGEAFVGTEEDHARFTASKGDCLHEPQYKPDTCERPGGMQHADPASQIKPDHGEPTAVTRCIVRGRASHALPEEHESISRSSARLFVRPEKAAETHAGPGFAFSMAARSQPDYIGPRKRAFSAIASTGSGPDQAEPGTATQDTNRGSIDQPYTRPVQPALVGSSADPEDLKNKGLKSHSQREHGGSASQGSAASPAPASPPACSGSITAKHQDKAQIKMPFHGIVDQISVVIDDDNDEDLRQWDQPASVTSPDASCNIQFQAPSGEQSNRSIKSELTADDTQLRQEAAAVHSPLTARDTKAADYPMQMPLDGHAAVISAGHVGASGSKLNDQEPLGSGDAVNACKLRRPVPSRQNSQAAVTGVGDEDSSSDTDDYLQIASYKIREKICKADLKFERERNALQAAIRHANEEKIATAAQLDGLQRQNHDLMKAVNDGEAKFQQCQRKLHSFKTFLDGLGRDMDSLRKTELAGRYKAESLFSEVKSHDAEQRRLVQCLQTRAETAKKLRDEALTACQAAQKESADASLRNAYLEKEVSDKTGLLTEERDRRVEVECQLARATSDRNTITGMMVENRQKLDATLDKLYMMHADFDDGQNEKTVETIRNACAMVQGLNTQVCANSDDIASIRYILDQLSEGLSSSSNNGGWLFQSLPLTSDDVKRHFEMAVTSLTSTIADREELIRQEADSSSTIASLQERLSACNDRLSESSSQIVALRARETELTEMVVSLQARLASRQTPLSPPSNQSGRFHEVTVELNAKAHALETAKAEMALNAAELQNLKETNTSLRDQASSLQVQVEGATSRASKLEADLQHLKSSHQTELLIVHKELKQAADDFQEQQKASIENEMKSLGAENEEARKKVSALEHELANCKADLQEAWKEQSTPSQSVCRELEAERRLAEHHKLEIDALRSSNKEAKSKLKDMESLLDKCSTLSARVAEATTRLEEMKQKVEDGEVEKEDLRKRIADLTASEHSAKADVAKLSTESKTQLLDLQYQLDQEKGEVQHLRTGMELLHESCKESMHKTEHKFGEQFHALQQRLEEAHDEVEKSKQADMKFREDVQKAWEEEQIKHKADLTESKRKVEAVAADKAKAAAEAEHLRKELNEITKMLKRDSTTNASRLTSERLNVELQNPLGDHPVNESQMLPGDAPLQVSQLLLDESQARLGKAITPEASNKENEPPRPRKKVDRNAGAPLQMNPIQAPEVLRSSISRGPDSATLLQELSNKDAHREIIVPLASQSSGWAEGSTHLHGHSMSASEDMLDTTTHTSHQPTLAIEQTPLDDTLPSFAAFNDGLESEQTSRRKSWRPAFDHRSQDQPITLSQEEKDKYRFKPFCPAPNSGKRRTLDKGSVAGSADRSVSTPYGQDNSETPLTKDVLQLVEHGAISKKSSSPDFLRNTEPFNVSVYHTPGAAGPGKQRASRGSQAPVACRGISREDASEPASKRRAVGEVADGWEAERKKRLKVQKSNQSSTSRYPLRRASHPLVNENSSELQSSSSQMRVRVVSSKSGRNAKTQKKTGKKNDGFGARFSQELGT